MLYGGGIKGQNLGKAIQNRDQSVFHKNKIVGNLLSCSSRVLLLELLNATFSIHEFYRSSIKRMADITNFYVDMLLG